MNEDLSNRLQAEFPDLYSWSPYAHQAQDYFLGFECGDGWFDILHDLSGKLTQEVKRYYEKYSDDEPVKFRSAQVKEKYGTLRFYMNYSTDEMNQLILEAERKSSRTCEICGKPGLIDSNGWIQVRCDEHNRC